MGYTIAKKRAAKGSSRGANDELITFEQFYEIVPEGLKADLLDGKVEPVSGAGTGRFLC